MSEGDPNISFAHLMQNVEKDTEPTIAPADFNAMMELDMATA